MVHESTIQDCKCSFTLIERLIIYGVFFLGDFFVAKCYYNPMVGLRTRISYCVAARKEVISPLRTIRAPTLKCRGPSSNKTYKRKTQLICGMEAMVRGIYANIFKLKAICFLSFFEDLCSLLDLSWLVEYREVLSWNIWFLKCTKNK